MLKNIPKLLSPDLIKVLMEMGHGDEIVIADGNYPSASNANILIRYDGLKIPDLLEQILAIFPLDTYIPESFLLMSLSGNDKCEPKIWQIYRSLLDESEAENKRIAFLERNVFYERGKKAYAIVATGEESLYANIILKKGVVQ